MHNEILQAWQKMCMNYQGAEMSLVLMLNPFHTKDGGGMEQAAKGGS